LNVTIANVTFDRVRYDAESDVLYLHNAEPSDAVRFDESPEGHHLRFDRTGRLVGITIVNPRWLLENEGEVSITLPERISLDRRSLNAALSAA